MCVRFAQTKSRAEVLAHFAAAAYPTRPDLAPRYDVAPSQTVAVVGAEPGGRSRRLVPLRWGLVPHWSSDGKPGPTNARSETVDRLPTFRESLRDRRCLIPADGSTSGRRSARRRCRGGSRSPAAG